MFLLVYPNKELRRISNRRPVYGNRVNLLKGSADGGGGGRRGLLLFKHIVEGN